MKLTDEKSPSRYIRILKIVKDDNDKPWLFYAEPQTHSYRTQSVKIEEQPRFYALKFRYCYASDLHTEDPPPDEILPVPDGAWHEKRRGWEDSPEQEQIHALAEACDYPPVIQAIELPFAPDKEFRVTDD